MNKLKSSSCIIIKPRLGVVGPFSGPRASYGEMLKKEILESKIQDYVDIIWRDDKADPVWADKIAPYLIKQDVFAVVGHFNSASAKVASYYYSSSNIPLLLPASTDPALAEMPCVFRFCPDDRQQIMAMLEFMRRHFYSSLAIWTDESSYGLRLQALLLRENLSDVRLCNISELKEGGLLILLGAHHKVADFLKEFKQLHPNVATVCCDDCSIAEFREWMSTCSDIWVAEPTPDFPVCVKEAAKSVMLFLKNAPQALFSDWLLSYPMAPVNFNVLKIC